MTIDDAVMLASLVSMASIRGRSTAAPAAPMPKQPRRMP